MNNKLKGEWPTFKESLVVYGPLVNIIITLLTVVEWLITNGADLTIPEENGYTPMHIAAFAGRPEAIKMLLEAKVNPSERGKDG